MFDIGFSELLLIGVVALIVLGPERLPKAARLTGLWIRRARAQWYSVKSELERDLAAEELRRSVRDAQHGLHSISEQVQQADTRLRQESRALHGDVQRALRTDLADDPHAVALDPQRGTRDDHAPAREALPSEEGAMLASAETAHADSDGAVPVATLDRDADPAVPETSRALQAEFALQSPPSRDEDLAPPKDRDAIG